MPEDQVFIQRRFSIMDDATGSNFSDAIILPLDEYDALDEKQIEILKQERFDNWKQAIKDAQDAPPPTKEEEAAALDEAIVAAQVALDDLQARKDAQGGKLDDGGGGAIAAVP